MWPGTGGHDRGHGLWVWLVAGDYELLFVGVASLFSSVGNLGNIAIEKGLNIEHDGMSCDWKYTLVHSSPQILCA